MATSLASLKTQILQPQAINVFIAKDDMAKLPDSIKELQKSEYINIESCDDLGSGMKLIPALNIRKIQKLLIVFCRLGV